MFLFIMNYPTYPKYLTKKKSDLRDWKLSKIHEKIVKYDVLGCIIDNISNV